MNGLLRLHDDMAFVELVPFRYILYMTMLSSVLRVADDVEDIDWGVCTLGVSELQDHFADWDPDDVEKALDELVDEGLILVEEDDVYVGEFRGRRFFTFEVKSSMCDDAKAVLEEALTNYGKSGSVKDRSRCKYIKEELGKWYDLGVENMNPGDFTELHGYLYEIYTGGEIYNIRNKTEYFQTSNMLKAYDRLTVFAILVEGVLHYDKYSKRGMPTLTNVAMAKDNIFRGLTHKEEGSKEYMRKRTDDEGTF